MNPADPTSASPDAGAWRFETKRVLTLAIPVVIAQVGSMLMGTVDTMMVGRVGEEALAAAALGNAWFYAVLLMGQGMVHGIDPLVSQAHGARDGAQAARALQKGVVVALLASVPLCATLAFTEEVLLASGQSPELAALAQDYIRVQIPSLPLYLLFMALRQYLQGREIMRPGMWVMAVANVGNLLFNWVLIFGGLGFPALGLLGAGIATGLTRGLMLGVLVAWVLQFRLHEGAWVPWDRSVLRPRDLAEVWRSGWPVAVQMSLEIWAFSLGTLIAGTLGATAVAAHTVVLNMVSLTFMTALGISQGVVTRIGNLIGAGDFARAQRAAWVGLALGATVMALAGLGFLLFREQLPRLYTEEAQIIALASTILPVAAAFQVFDGTQAVGCGILRGMGRTLPGAGFNLLGYWVLGLPVGWWLAHRAGFGLEGIWWGFVIGLAVVALSLVAWLAFRGPGHLGRRAG
ncbi:MAG: MATE family efflux transporter [Myxococcota bacterium]|jgi:MATE family multidrug resistance protein|nr:MATE family efflux transporter [Myxococcota bacterium]